MIPKLVIEREVEKRGSQSAVAKWLGVSRAHVSDMLHGRREPGPRILKKLGLRKNVTRSVSYAEVEP